MAVIDVKHDVTVRRDVSPPSSRWWMFVVLGVVLAVLGVFAMGAASIATLTSVLVFGWALMIGGVLQAVHAVYEREWGARILDVLTGVLFVVVGALAVWRPLASAVSLTLVIAMALMIRGLFAIVAAATERYWHWGWTVFYGVVSIVLGGLIVAQWPGISLWLIGLFVGIELLVDGFVLSMIGVSIRAGRAREKHLRPPEHEARGPREPLPAT